MATYTLGNEFMIIDGSCDASGVINASAKLLGYGTECTLTLSADTIETSNKQLGWWGGAMAGVISWTMSSSSLYVADDSSVDTYAAIYDKFVGHGTVPVVIGQIKEASKSKLAAGTALAASDFQGKFYGDAYITSLELSASNNEACSYSVEFSGNGKLVKCA